MSISDYARMRKHKKKRLRIFEFVFRGEHAHEGSDAHISQYRITKWNLEFTQMKKTNVRYNLESQIINDHIVNI